QPRNASPLSVHPAGMAVDLRVSRDAACREWLSAELLELEAMELIDATLERRPPHYHIAVFPIQFGQYAAQMAAVEAAEAERTAQEAARQADLAAALMELTPRVVQLEPLRLLEGLASIVALLFLPITV
ncbi:MAG: hypothetical protein ACREK1_12120, partial [Longimicrobiales bacterium]